MNVGLKVKAEDYISIPRLWIERLCVVEVLKRFSVLPQFPVKLTTSKTRNDAGRVFARNNMIKINKSPLQIS